MKENNTKLDFIQYKSYIPKEYNSNVTFLVKNGPFDKLVIFKALYRY